MGIMSQRMRTILAAAVMSGCWTLISGTVLVMALAAFAGVPG
jgi:hypothetical protein